MILTDFCTIFEFLCFSLFVMYKVTLKRQLILRIIYYTIKKFKNN